MIHLIPYVAIAGLLLLLLWQFWRQAVDSPDAPPSKPLDSLPLSPRFESRVFGPDDSAFIGRLNAPGLEQFFSRERRNLAHAWLGYAIREAEALVRIHRVAARASRNADLLLEVKILGNYLLFLAWCRCLGILIRLRGPARLQAVLRSTEARSERLYELVGSVFPVSASLHDTDRYFPGGTVA